MKKASDYLKEYLQKTPDIKNEACWSDQEVLHFAKSYAMHVAAEQDKLTRHAAIDVLLDEADKKNSPEGFLNTTQQRIINLQTKIKETQL